MMHCTVFRSGKKAETYLYLALGRDFDELPVELRQAFGKPVRVMELELTSRSRLAWADPNAVIKRLERDGYYLQLPPRISTEELISRKFS